MTVVYLKSIFWNTYIKEGRFFHCMTQHNIEEYHRKSTPLANTIIQGQLSNDLIVELEYSLVIVDYFSSKSQRVFGKPRSISMCHM